MDLFRDTPIRQKLVAISLLSSAAALLLACVALITYEVFAFRDVTLQPPPRLLDIGRAAARAAATVCLDVLDEAPEVPEAMAKLGREPVTIADYGSQAVILEAVAASSVRPA